MAADVLKVNDNAQDKLRKYIEAAYDIRDEGWQLRTRLEEVDRAHMREGDISEEQRKAQTANRLGDKTKLQQLQPPMVLESTENTVGFLTNVFLTEYPMFKFTTDPEKMDLALMWNTLVGEDQNYFKWAGELNIAFRNGAKYNFSPIEVEWCKKRRYKVMNGTGNNGTKLEQVIWEGNKIRALDPYNLIYDPRVPIHKVHTEGEFVGYIEQMSRIRVKMLLADLGDDRLKNDVKAFESADWGVQYYVPSINPKIIIKNSNWQQGAFDWTKWAFGGAQNHIAYKNMYTVVTLYARLMPFEFGVQAPRDQTPDIWKLVAINGIMVYAQPMPNAHDILPIIIGQPKVEIDSLSFQVKSQAENQVPFQDMVGALWNAKLAIARRLTSDRMIYNPLLIDPDHINSPNPAAKIPIRPTAYGRKLEEAVYKIPFEDGQSGQYLQDAEGISRWSMRMDGRNNTSMGQYQKGNKLNDEFHETMANAGIMDRTQALMWEAFALTDIKIILKSNYLQFTPKGERYNREEEKTVNIDPVELRKAAAEFEIGDGLLPSQRLARTDVMAEGFRALQADTQLRAGYDLPPMFSYMMKVQGVDKLSKFEKSKEQRQYEMAISTWQSTMTEISKKVGGSLGNGKFFTIEDAQKLIGPMPTPEQFGLKVPNANPAP